MSKIKDGEVNIFNEQDPRIFPPCDTRYMIAIFLCMLYPTIYDGTQCLKQGRAYFLYSSNSIAKCLRASWSTCTSFSNSFNSALSACSKTSLMPSNSRTCCMVSFFFWSSCRRRKVSIILSNDISPLGAVGLSGHTRHKHECEGVFFLEKFLRPSPPTKSSRSPRARPLDQTRERT